MVSRKPFYLLVALLYIVGLGMTIYHHIALDVPLTPGEKAPDLVHRSQAGVRGDR